MAQISSTKQKPEQLLPDTVTYESLPAPSSDLKQAVLKVILSVFVLGNDGTFQFTVFIKIQTNQPE
ncbi:hypothetical protein LKL24_10850 [Bacillus halotolerans]|uniref:hypothetical protein n=1 Tax=Bacillus halotolerans TaxID=260554 RepID=UPI0011580E35|nr:hypothetical protein [Bacillus halotolerans]MCC2527909.1 hypothetical protein [Bacillus halotolerans]